MIERTVRNRRYLQFDRLRGQVGLVHAITTAPQNLNPAEDATDPAGAQRARDQAVRDVGLAPDKLCFARQIHQTRIGVIDEPRGGGPIAQTDALITNLPHTPLMSFSADCPLLLIYDPQRHVVATVHAGWRCIVAGLPRLVLSVLGSRFGTRPADLLVGVGPGAGPCCYEVGEDIRAAARAIPDADACFQPAGDRYKFDLWRACRAQLVAGGVRPDRVENADLCTICRADLFPSFRRDGAASSRFALVAGILRR